MHISRILLPISRIRSTEKFSQIDLDMLFLVMRRRTPEHLFETPAKMRLVTEAGPLGNLAYGAGVVRQQPGSEMKAQFSDQLAGGPAEQGVELAVELGNAQVHFFGKAFDTEIFLVEVAENAVTYLFQEKTVAASYFGMFWLGRQETRYHRGFRKGGNFLHGFRCFSRLLEIGF